jgi:hypothetical protein
MVDLVEDGEGSLGQCPERRRAGRELLVRDDRAVHVGREPAPRRPLGLEVQAEGGGRIGPLVLQVAGGRDHDHASGLTRRQCPTGRRQRERGLAGTGGRDREEIGAGTGVERFEGSLLPASEPEGLGHRGLGMGER